jgi:hypothetical protein
MRWAVWLLVLTLTACSTTAKPHRYFVSYEKLLADTTFEAIRDRKDLPWDVKFAYSDCGAAYVVSQLTPAERARLDSYARGQVQLSPAEAREIDGRINARGLEFENLAAVCPDKAPLFEPYLN